MGELASNRLFPDGTERDLAVMISHCCHFISLLCGAHAGDSDMGTYSMKNWSIRNLSPQSGTGDFSFGKRLICYNPICKPLVKQNRNHFRCSELSPLQNFPNIVTWEIQARELGNFCNRSQRGLEKSKRRCLTKNYYFHVITGSPLQGLLRSFK